jgi:hypothetical protein
MLHHKAKPFHTQHSFSTAGYAAEVIPELQLKPKIMVSWHFIPVGKYLVAFIRHIFPNY